ncbi:hypothetical protein Hanom_Chr03g00181951 [Helianthus anomalus]
MDGPCGLHFVMHLVPNLDMLKPFTKCKPQEPSVYFWKAKDQIQNFGKPQGPSVYLTLFIKNKSDLLTSFEIEHNPKRPLKFLKLLFFFFFLFNKNIRYLSSWHKIS